MSGLPNLVALVEQATPGPWKKLGRMSAVGTDKFVVVCSTWNDPDDPRRMQEANPTLIAAAPAMAQLLIACEQALSFADDALACGDAPIVADWHRDHSEASADDCLVCEIRAALARLADFDQGIA